MPRQLRANERKAVAGRQRWGLPRVVEPDRCVLHHRQASVLADDGPSDIPKTPVDAVFTETEIAILNHVAGDSDRPTPKNGAH